MLANQPNPAEIKLNSDQQHVLDDLNDFMEDKDQMFFRFDGPAGTGKSTLSSRFVMMQSQMGRTVALSAPTNKASRNLKSMKQRICEGLGYEIDIPTGTAFSMLGLVLGKEGEYRELASTDRTRLDGVNALVLDERGMVNSSLWGHLRDYALEHHMKVILTGDPYQLPPVVSKQERERLGIGPDDSCPSPTERLALNGLLSKVERHDNQILNLATHVRECIDAGTMPEIRQAYDENGGVYVLRGKDFRKQIRKAFSSQAYMSDGYAFKALAWRNATVEDLNDSIRDEMYDGSPATPFEIGERIVAKAPVLDIPAMLYDKVERFVAATDEEGQVISVSKANHPLFESIECYLVVWETDDGAKVSSYLPTRAGQGRWADMKESLFESAKESGGRAWASYWGFVGAFSDLLPCHSLTVHRAQGSTYRTCFVELDDIYANKNMGERLRLAYTAFTRPSKNLIIKLG